MRPETVAVAQAAPELWEPDEAMSAAEAAAVIADMFRAQEEPEEELRSARPCRCAHVWEFEPGHCCRCGHDVRWEVIGDELRPYWADDRAAHPDDGRLTPDDE